MSSFKMICRLIAQRAHEDPAFVEPEHRKTLGFYYLMSQAPARWIAMADQLAEHAIVGMTRELMALGPFAGLRISTRAVLINAGIENVVQLRAALAARAIALDEDIAGNGLHLRPWSKLGVWRGVQVDGCDAEAAVATHGH